MTGVIGEANKLYIRDICNGWGISRTLVQKAIKQHTISGVRNDQGKWCFDKSEIERWRGKAKNDLQNSENKDEIIIILKGQIADLKEQVQKKDEQIFGLQQSMHDQMKLLTFHGNTDQSTKLQEEIEKRDRQIEKLTNLKVEHVVEAIKPKAPSSTFVKAIRSNKTISEEKEDSPTRKEPVLSSTQRSEFMEQLRRKYLKNLEE